MKKQAAVMVIIDINSQSLILTERSKEMPIHAGEISFPGGRMQSEDENTEQTALRETHEEIGIEPEKINIIKRLDTVLTLTGYEITPYLAEIDSISGYQLQPEEVEKLIELPIEMVKQKQLYQTISRKFGGYTVKTLCFSHPEHFIWGATAKIMLQLVDLDA